VAFEVEKPHYNVLIATPGKMAHNAYIKSLVETTKWLQQRGLTYKWLNSASSFIPNAREQTALDEPGQDWYATEIGCGQYTYDKIFWIDSDIEWNVEDFEKIYDSEFPVISGLYLLDQFGTVACSLFDEEYLPKLTNQKDFTNMKEPVQVFGVGFGFVAMKSGVFEACSRPWFKIRHMQKGIDPAPINVGEDYSWCLNARENGFKIMVDPTVKIGHHKATVWHLK
jgi:GT2 family glycosyltransferase